jgi:hypothetical protein
LFDQFPADYSARWNRIAHTVNDWFPSVIAPVIRERLTDVPESEIVIQDVLRSIRGAFMEHEYQNCNPPVRFYTSLLELFETGRYPCGWQLPWPDGKLVVF